MKRIITAASALCALLATATSCNDTVERVIYDGPEFVMFQDTLNDFYVTKEGLLSVVVTATSDADYDRTYGVEVVAKGSTAIEDYHFNLVSDNITIKAGQRTAQVEIQPHFEHFEPTDSLGAVLRLVVPEPNEWNLYGLETKVTFEKYCDFSSSTWFENEKRELDAQKYDYANYILHASFPYTTTPGQYMKLLVKVVADPKDDHRLIIKEPFQKGRDLKIRLIEVKPGEDYVQMLPVETLYTNDYGWITMATDELNPSYYNTCKRYIELNLNCYVESLASFGVYPYYLQWITERAAEEIRNNGF